MTLQNVKRIPLSLCGAQSEEALMEKDEIDENGRYCNVSTPEIMPFLPSTENANGTCILICPGGSYRILAWVTHVERLAALFVPMGYAVVGLKYRTTSPENDVPKTAQRDLEQALQVVSTHAEEWNINPQRIVGLGYSAGSNLLLNHCCRAHSQKKRPFPSTAGSSLCGMALLCLWPNNMGVNAYPVSPVVPKVFLCATEEDETGPASFSRGIADKMLGAGVKVTTRIYSKGDHLAFNFGVDGPKVDWTPSFLKWLEEECLD